MGWLQGEVLGFEGVTNADIRVEGTGQPTLVVRLSQVHEPEPRSPIDSLLNANVAPMLAYDTETLAVVRTSAKATDLFQVQDGAAYSLADLFAPSELERLGTMLAAHPQDWGDGEEWTVLTASGDPVIMQIWLAPQGRSPYRLLVCASSS